MKNKYKTRWEEVAKVDEPFYLKAWSFYNKRGRAIPPGVEVRLTDWAIENGLGDDKGVDGAVKVRNSSAYNHSIIVQRKGLKSQTSYWAGFWEPA